MRLSLSSTSAVQESARADLRTERDALGAAAKDAAAGTDQSRVVVRPLRGGQLEQTLALGEADFRVGVGIDEDVTMVESGDQLEVVRLQQPVAEHVARHVADSHHRDRRTVREVASPSRADAADRFPRAARGNTERLVVVAVTAARRESVAQPEVVLSRDRVGQIGKGRRALVGGHHQVGAVLVEHFDARRMHGTAVDHVVGQFEHRADERLVGVDHVVMIGRAAQARLDDEAALGAGRHDDRVLDRLGFHQVEDFGAKVVGPVAIADTAARDTPCAQMTSLHSAGCRRGFRKAAACRADWGCPRSRI